MQDVQRFGDLVKAELKRQGLTQQEFAQLMKTSVPTLKRWLRGEGVLLRDWIKMLECLGLGLSDALLRLDGSAQKSFTYTLKQEQLLSTEAGLLAFFDQLLKGRSPKQIARQHTLTEASVVFYLSKLERVGLVEWLPGNRVKLLVSGEPSWISAGPLAQKFRRQIIDGFVEGHIDDRERLKIGLYSLSKGSRRKLSALLDELAEKVRNLEVRDAQDPESKKLTTVILGQGTDDVPILTKIPNRS